MVATIILYHTLEIERTQPLVITRRVGDVTMGYCDPGLWVDVLCHLHFSSDLILIVVDVASDS